MILYEISLQIFSILLIIIKELSFKILISLKTQVDHFFDPPFILIFVCVVNLGCLAISRGIGVGVSEERADGGQNCPYIVNGTPLILKYV